MMRDETTFGLGEPLSAAVTQAKRTKGGKNSDLTRTGAVEKKTFTLRKSMAVPHLLVPKGHADHSKP